VINERADMRALKPRTKYFTGGVGPASAPLREIEVAKELAGSRRATPARSQN
jgi:hypothetical protein